MDCYEKNKIFHKKIITLYNYPYNYPYNYHRDFKWIWKTNKLKIRITEKWLWYVYSCPISTHP